VRQEILECPQRARCWRSHQPATGRILQRAQSQRPHIGLLAVLSFTWRMDAPSFLRDNPSFTGAMRHLLRTEVATTRPPRQRETAMIRLCDPQELTEGQSR